MIRLPSADALEAALRAFHVQEHQLPGRANAERAGVLVPLRWRGGRVEVIATLRPDALRRHGGEVSFPGGRREPHDLDLTATALREAREELGLHAPRVLGRLSSMPVYTSDFRLEPFVAEVPADVVLTPDPGEVAAVLSLDLGEVLAEGRIEGVVIPREDSPVPYVMPVFRLDGNIMFGATALSLLELVGVVAELARVPTPEIVPGALDFHDVLARKAAAGR